MLGFTLTGLKGTNLYDLSDLHDVASQRALTLSACWESEESVSIFSDSLPSATQSGGDETQNRKVSQGDKLTVGW